MAFLVKRTYADIIPKKWQLKHMVGNYGLIRKM